MLVLEDEVAEADEMKALESGHPVAAIKASSGGAAQRESSDAREWLVGAGNHSGIGGFAVHGYRAKIALDEVGGDDGGPPVDVAWIVRPAERLKPSGVRRGDLGERLGELHLGRREVAPQREELEVLGLRLDAAVEVPRRSEGVRDASSARISRRTMSASLAG